MTTIKEEREMIAAAWLRVNTPKLVDMTDLLLVQEARQRYIKKDNGFTMPVGILSETLGINAKHVKRRLHRLTRFGVFTRTRHPQGDTEQYKGYSYRLGWEDNK